MQKTRNRPQEERSNLHQNIDLPQKPGPDNSPPTGRTRLFSTLQTTVIFNLASLIVCLAFTTEPQADANRTGYGQNIRLTEQLFSNSVASRQIDEGNNTEAKQLKAQALELLEQARAAEAAGDPSRRDELLRESKQKMFSAMRLSGDKVVADKQQQDLRQRLDNVKAMREAWQRVAAEKKPADAEQINTQVEHELDSSQREQGRGNYQAALDHVNNAYVTLKLAIVSLRHGDTLTTSLAFASKEEEYRYELDRNDTHKMLVNVLLKEKLERSGMSRMVSMVMDKVDKLRDEANQRASEGNYKAAIELMEEATAQVVRLIRAAGIYIPG